MLSTVCQQELHVLIHTLPSIDVLLPAAGPQRKAVLKTHSYVMGISEGSIFQKLLILNITFFLFDLIFTSLGIFSQRKLQAVPSGHGFLPQP